jgi:hypothetical protein
VRDGSHLVTRTATTGDLGLQLAQFGEPFLLVGQIENHIRGLIADKYTKKELANARDPADSGREINDVADLTLGECVRLVENKERWPNLSLRLDRKVFVDELQRAVACTGRLELWTHPTSVIRRLPNWAKGGERKQ